MILYDRRWSTASAWQGISLNEEDGEEPKMKIGQLATRAGVNASAIRYYEKLNLLPAPERQYCQRR